MNSESKRGIGATSVRVKNIDHVLIYYDKNKYAAHVNRGGRWNFGAGFRVEDLGMDTKAKEFIEAVKEHDAKIVGMSALLTTTMGQHQKEYQSVQGGRPGRDQDDGGRCSCAGGPLRRDGS